MSGCIDLLFWSSGCRSESRASARVDSQTEVINEVLANQSITVAESGVLAQNIEFINDGFVECPGGFYMTNEMKATILFVVNMSAKALTQLETRVEEAIDANVSALTLAETEFLSKAANGLSVSELVIMLKKSIRNTIYSNEFASLVQAFDLRQTLTVRNRGTLRGKDCVLANNLQLRLESQAIVDLFTKNIMMNETLSRVAAAVEAMTHDDNKGISGIVKAILAVVLLILVVTFALPMFITGVGKATGKATQALAAGFDLKDGAKILRTL